MANIFNRKIGFGGAIKMDTAVVTFSSNLGAGVDNSGVYQGLLVQNINIQYTQPINVLWSLTSTNGYEIIGRPEGRAGMAGVVAESSILMQFLKQFGDACKATSNTLTVTSKAETCAVVTPGATALPDALGGSLYLSYCTITDCGFSVDTGNFMMMNNVNIRFIELQDNSTMGPNLPI